jgi:hypothetical protein
MFLAQLEQEAVATRRTSERVPEGRYDWKPHEKSMTLGYLSGLVASLPGGAEFMIERDELDLSHPSAELFKAKVLENRIVSVFPFRNRVSPTEAFEGLELGEGKPSRPVLRGLGGRKAAWLLGIYRSLPAG